MSTTAADLMALSRVIPVVVLDDADDAVPLARALLAGGVPIMELTLRTPVALESIARVAEQVPDMLVGAGTITRPEQATMAVAAGARFLVSPGSPEPLVTAMLAERVPVLPGVATATEALALLRHGITEMKFFPAGPAGGPSYLEALAGPLPGVTFCPTGGVNHANAADYLALPNVACVGGSWLTPPTLVKGGYWDEISRLCFGAWSEEPQG
ncbi:MAG TPA: bifunctional 4-hydroxy-2-oxoglutarate aldolase/2-dehydro-3-deoxy-phosphogluconate aldolase [Pseudonocardia sp.]